MGGHRLLHQEARPRPRGRPSRINPELSRPDSGLVLESPSSLRFVASLQRRIRLVDDDGAAWYDHRQLRHVAGKSGRRKLRHRHLRIRRPVRHGGLALTGHPVAVDAKHAAAATLKEREHVRRICVFSFGRRRSAPAFVNEEDPSAALSGTINTECSAEIVTFRGVNIS